MSVIGPFEVTRWPDLSGEKGFGRHCVTCEDVVIKVGSSGDLQSEAHTLNAASGGIGVPLLRWFENVNGKDIMITDAYGPCLEEVFCRSGRYFSMQTLLLYALQLLSRIEFLHSRNIIHGGLNPWSFALGSAGWQKQQIFLVDFNTEAGWKSSTRDDAQAIGRILAYFYSGAQSWEQYERCTPKNVAPVFNAILQHAYFAKSIDYDLLRNIVHDAHQDLAVQMAVSLDLKGPRSIAESVNRTLDTLSAMRSEALFETLDAKLSLAGRMIRDSDSGQRPRSLLKCLREILEIYTVLFIRDKPSIERSQQILKVYHLPNRLWRDLQWFLNNTTSAPIETRLAIVSKIYTFIGAMRETKLAYELYWLEYLLALARSRKEIEPSNGKPGWTQTVFYWQHLVNKIRAETTVNRCHSS